MIPRIYIDTSIIGGYYDEEFQEVTRALFNRLENHEIIFIISDLLQLELMQAPVRVQELLLKFPEAWFEHVSITKEITNLADAYIVEKVVGRTSLEDCRHIAMATVYRADVLVSWNFKHIVNLDRIKGYNSVNLREGYPPLAIRSPKDLIDYENE
jgi:predicted nucleic acid-binding protein